MVYEFKSRATGNLVMTQDVAERLLGLIGKSAGATGIITVDQMPQAIQTLQAAVSDDKAASAAGASADKADDDTAGQAVGLSQRAFPLIEMMQRASKAGKDITWGI